MKLVCRQCGIHYEKGKFCLECGSPLEEVQVQKVLYCANCQMVVESGKFCPECGTKLEEREVEVSTSTNSKSHTVAAMEIETVSTNISSGDEEIETILSKYRDEYGAMRTLNTEEYAVAAEELQKCVDKGNVEAMCFLADLYMDGHGVPKDETVAYNLLRKAEDLGSEYAKANMAIFYLNGMIVQQDVDEALERLNRGYKELQHPGLAGLLAYFYYNMGDYKAALKYATESAEKNEKWGLTVLGGIYLDGHGVEVDEAKAFDCYMQAASMGDEMALTQLGMMYVEGRGVEQDPTQGYFWLNESAQKGHNEGMYALAFCYKDGFGVEQDVEKAAEWFKKSAEAGYVDAMLELANYYRESLIDYDKAKYWLNQAAEQGNAEAMNQLGVFYSDTMCDDTSAVKWYKKAVELDEPNAFRNLALCYRDGKGVKKNEKKALELLAQAEKMGIEDAQELIKGMTKYDGDDIVNNANAHYEKKQYDEALAMYQDAAQYGNPKALYNIGLCYLYGFGVKKNVANAIEYFIEASHRAFPVAFQTLHDLSQKSAFSKVKAETLDHIYDLSSIAMQMKRLDKSIGDIQAHIKNLHLEIITQTCHKTIATADIEVCGMSNEHIRVDYYLYSKSITTKEKNKILKNASPNYRLGSSWNIVVPYNAVKWEHMPCSTYIQVDVPKNEERDFILHVIVWDSEHKAILTQQEKTYRIKHVKPFLGKESWEVKTI